jgi:colanic acid/amylovoran biosynthesis glycosyltransferase
MNGSDRRLHAARRRGITYIIGTYPDLTITFIDREIRQLRAHGVDVRIVSLRRPAGRLSPEQEGLRDGVSYVLPVGILALLRSHLRFLVTRPLAFLGALTYLVSRPHRSWQSRAKTVLHFVEGVQVASLLRDDVPPAHLHAHFVDRAATVALVAGRLLAIPYSATAHASDIYVAPTLLPEKLNEARFVATCTSYNAAHLTAVGGDGAEVVRIYHGLDIERYVPPASRPPGSPPVILAVGQLKERKGFGDLVEACARLRDDGYAFTCHIVGEGPLRATLEARIARLALEDVVMLLGALPHDEVIAQYRAATLFALPCVTGADGDRDGIPNVILEAMAMQLPVVSTRISGVPEAVEHGISGLLVASEEPVGMADAIAELLDDPDRRTEMGIRAREAVTTRFDLVANAEQLLARFEEVPT